MNGLAFRWRKAVNGLLLCAILFLTILPYFGWVWHSVLPEHEHVFLGLGADYHDELLHLLRIPHQDYQPCLNCAGTQLSPGVVHLAGLTLQIMGLAMIPDAAVELVAPPVFVTHVDAPALFYPTSSLSPLDPPPIAS